MASVGNSSERDRREASICERLRPELVAYLDGELDAAARAEVEAHLAACAACRREREGLARAGALLELVPPAPIGPRFEARVRERIARAEPKILPLRAPSRLPRVVAAAAIAAAILILGTGVALKLARVSDPAKGPRPQVPPIVVRKEPQAPRPARGRPPAEVFQPGEAPPEIGEVPPEPALEPAEEAMIAKLHILEDLEIAENLELLEAYEGPEDPTQGLFEEGKG